MQGKKDTPSYTMPEKSEGDTIQRGRIQNMWGEGHGLFPWTWIRYPLNKYSFESLNYTLP